MYDNFNKLTEDKQRLILEAALKEFTQNGFDKASTNAIIKAANISKGSLFNYFKSKKDLYIYLMHYSIEVVEMFYDHIDYSETDLFKRLENIGLQKLKIHQDFPNAFDFMADMLTEDSPVVKSLVTEKMTAAYSKGMDEIFSGIDYSKFKDDVDIEKAAEILNWTMVGFTDKYLAQIDTFEKAEQFSEEVFKEWQVYSEILKKSFYK